MEYALFGNTGMSVSRLCLGAMTFSKAINDDDAGRVIDEALDRGVNFIDTADSYAESEVTLGKHLGDGKRDRVFIVSKVFRQFTREKHAARNSRTNIVHNVDRSLARLRTDHLDLFLLHHPDPQTPVEQTLHTLDTLVKQGKIRYWGVSNHYAWQMTYMLGLSRERHLEPLSCVQSSYSILERQIEQEIVPMLQRFNIALMCYSPLGGGILTGKYHPESGEPASSERAEAGKFRARVEDESVGHIVRSLRGIAKEQGLEMNQLATAWLLSKPWATTVLMGGSKPEHFTPIYEVADRRLPDDVVERIDELSLPRVYCEPINQPQRAGAPFNVNA